MGSRQGKENVMILITGGGGFLGLNMARCLAEKGKKVLLLQRHEIQRPALLTPFWGKEVRQATGNILDLPSLLGLIKEHAVESVIHGAFDASMLVGGPKAGISKAVHQLVQVQIQGTTNVLEAARLFDFRRVTLISSVDVYRGSPRDCDEWREEAFLPPVSSSPVCNTKKASEQLCFLYAKAYDLSIASLRVGRVYGPEASHAHEPIKTMTENAVRGKPSDISGVPGDSRGHTVYAKDVGDMTCLVHLAESLKYPIYNVAYGGDPTMNEVAHVVKEWIPDAEITLGPESGQSPYSGVTMDRMKEEFGFVPRDLREGIKAYIDWLREEKY
jgi:nucleoside-diphosphate-sugar epimerase